MRFIEYILTRIGRTFWPKKWLNFHIFFCELRIILKGVLEHMESFGIIFETVLEHMESFGIFFETVKFEKKLGKSLKIPPKNI